MITIASPTEAKKRRFTLPTGDFDIFIFFHFDLFYCTQIQDCYCLRQLAATEN